MKNRLISKDIKSKNASKFGRILVITGARQTGKTTLINHIFPNYTYIPIEDPMIVDQYKSLTASQWELSFPKSIIDEIQKEPQIIESIKSVYDQYPDTRYILLGSSQIMLLKKIRESLAGRCQIIEMYPLTLPELSTDSWNDKVKLSTFQTLLLEGKLINKLYRLEKDFAKKQDVYNTYLRFGGYPAISDKDIPDEEKYDWLKNYTKTYLERDIRDLAEIRNLEPFTKTQKLIAINTGTFVNYSKIASEAGVTSKTVQRFVEYMNISYQILILQPWSRNIKKRLVKSPKIHMIDVGVMRSVLQKRGELTGREFESAIVTEIYKQIKTANIEAQLYHLRTTDGREIDLLIESEHGYIAIEIKQSSKVRPVDARHLRDIEDILDKPVLHKIVISNDPNFQELEEGVFGVPGVMFLM